MVSWIKVIYALRIFHSKYSVLLIKRYTHRVLLSLFSSLDRFFSKKVADLGNQLISLLRQSNHLQKNALKGQPQMLQRSQRGQGCFFFDFQDWWKLLFRKHMHVYVFVHACVCVCSGKVHNSGITTNFSWSIMWSMRTCLDTDMYLSCISHLPSCS